jgi:hypothetical protein
LAGSLSFSPFANVSIPSATAVVYAGCYFAIILGAAMVSLNRRDL